MDHACRLFLGLDQYFAYPLIQQNNDNNSIENYSIYPR
jgi:hypothetical protein